MDSKRPDAKNESESLTAAEVTPELKFIANVSHELRTPLTALLGFADVLLEKELSVAEREKATNAILRNGSYLLSLVNSILDYSKIEAGKLEVESISAAPLEILADVSTLLRHKAHEKGLAFGIECKYPIPKHISSDPTRIKQILINLTGNAIKFTNTGGVKIVMSFSKQNEQLIFEVIDSGPGITEEGRAKLFKDFSQTDSSIARLHGGTGLGLAISKRLTKLLGGDLILKSEPDKGSRFIASLKTGRIDPDTLIDLSPTLEARILERCKATVVPNLKGSVLVVDDVTDNQELLRYLLEKAKLEYCGAANGEKAVEAASKVCYDAILMDTEMPVMDGITATRILRKAGYRGNIIALTGYTGKDAREKYLSLGFDDYLAKPFQREKFYDLLRHYLQERDPEEENRTPLKPKLVEDFSGFAGIVLKFLDGLPERVNLIQSSYNSKDWPMLRTLAHRLIGSETFGYPDLTSLAREIEKTVENKTFHEAPGKIERLSLLCNRIIAGRDYVVALVEELAPLSAR